MPETTTFAPAGWYPDPGGEPQWRVWTGERWSETVRPYAANPTATPRIGRDALDYLRRYGVLVTFAGLGLLVSVLAHWPGTANAESPWFAVTASNAAIGLLGVGAVIYALAARELDGRWSPLGVTPGLNVLYVGATLAARVSGRRPLVRVGTELVLLVLFVTQAHAETWLVLVPALVGLGHVSSLELLREAGPLHPASAS